MAQWTQSSSPTESVPPLHQHVNTPLGGPRAFKAHSGRRRPRRDSSGFFTVWKAPEREKQTTMQSLVVEQTPGMAKHNRGRERLQHGAIGTVLVPFKDVPALGKNVNTPSGAAGHKTDLCQHTPPSCSHTPRLCVTVSSPDFWPPPAHLLTPHLPAAEPPPSTAGGAFCAHGALAASCGSGAHHLVLSREAAASGHS